MRTTIVKGCVYCGLRLPNTAHFCPECGRPVEDVFRVDSEVNMVITTIAKGCLYCGLQLPDSVDFCPECGRPIERGRLPHVAHEEVADSLETRFEGKDDLVRQQEASSDGRDPLAQETSDIRDEHVNVIALVH